MRIATRLVLPKLLSGWTMFGPIGTAMCLMTWMGVIAIAWVATILVGAMLWERNAPEDDVIAAQDESSPG